MLCNGNNNVVKLGILRLKLGKFSIYFVDVSHLVIFLGITKLTKLPAIPMVDEALPIISTVGKIVVLSLPCEKIISTDVQVGNA